MAKWAHANVLDNGLNHIKTNGTAMRLVSTYTANDSLGTVTTNTLASATMTSTDFTLAGAASAPRTCTTASGKSATASATGGGASNHIAFTSATEVLWVTNETSLQAVTSGNTINFPSLVYTSDQPI